MKAGGCAIFNLLVNTVTCARLLEESQQCLHHAVASHVALSDGEEVRGGNPARSFVSAPGGSEQIEFYNSPQTSQFLAEICNAPVEPTGKTGIYSYYRPRDHLASIATSTLAMFRSSLACLIAACGVASK